MKPIEIPEYLKGHTPSIDKECARRYRVLYRLKHGLPMTTKVNWDNYCRYLGLVDQQPNGAYTVSKKGEECFFNPDNWTKKIINRKDVR